MDDLIYKGLGFPVLLRGVKTREFRGEILPDINHRELEDVVFRELLWLPAHFSGDHLSFVRGYLGLSQKEFATTLGLKTHATISSWEGKGGKVTGMPKTTEVVIRLIMAEFLKEDEFALHFREFLGLTKPPKKLEVKVA